MPDQNQDGVVTPSEIGQAVTPTAPADTDLFPVIEPGSRENTPNDNFKIVQGDALQTKITTASHSQLATASTFGTVASNEPIISVHNNAELRKKFLPANAFRDFSTVASSNTTILITSATVNNTDVYLNYRPAAGGQNARTQKISHEELNYAFNNIKSHDSNRLYQAGSITSSTQVINLNGALTTVEFIYKANVNTSNNPPHADWDLLNTRNLSVSRFINITTIAAGWQDFHSSIGPGVQWFSTGAITSATISASQFTPYRNAQNQFPDPQIIFPSNEMIIGEYNNPSPRYRINFNNVIAIRASTVNRTLVNFEAYIYFLDLVNNTDNIFYTHYLGGTRFELNGDNSHILFPSIGNNLTIDNSSVLPIGKNVHRVGILYRLENVGDDPTNRTYNISWWRPQHQQIFRYYFGIDFVH